MGHGSNGGKKSPWKSPEYRYPWIICNAPNISYPFMRTHDKYLFRRSTTSIRRVDTSPDVAPVRDPCCIDVTVVPNGEHRSSFNKPLAITRLV